MADVAIPGGCTPDTISSDIHVFSGNSPGTPFLPNVMSKFLAMGFPLEQVVAMATIAPAKIINRAPKIGTLQVGAGANGVFRVPSFEEALKKRFSPKSLEGMSIPADGMNSDIHGSPEYRAHLVGVLSRRAVADAIGKPAI